MTNRASTKAHRASAPLPPRRQVPVLAIALGALALVVAVGLAIALGGDDDGTSTASSALVFGTVAVEGRPLGTFDAAETDATIGEESPVVTGQSTDGSIATVGGAGEPTVLAFLAHWCPHCQAELPLLVDVAESGGFDGVRTVAVLTGTNPDAPNFPPADWLDREGWSGDVLVDDEAFTAASAFGVAGYPFLVALDAGGTVVARSSGELPADALEAMAAAARGEQP